jgi:dienelactone hydrolase
MKRFGAILWLVGLTASLGVSADCAAQLVVPGASVERVSIPWQPGNRASLWARSPDGRWRRVKHGALPTTIIRPNRPDRQSAVPFVVLLHGCGGLSQPAMWWGWVKPWATLLSAHGIGTAVVDSFAPRGIRRVCGFNVAAWAVRRADDAYSVRAWLARQPYGDAARIAVMGMSNGGRTVLAALRADRHHTASFRAGIALYPGCQSDIGARFYAPLLVFSGRADTVTPAVACEAMARKRRGGAEIKLIVYDYAPHTFDMNLPDRVHLGMRLGYDPQATEDARRRVIAFLKAHGMGLKRGKRR